MITMIHDTFLPRYWCVETAKENTWKFQFFIKRKGDMKLDRLILHYE